ncbi:MAG: TetR/AcrR family transcriptional regulator [Rhodospirillales bacterium]|jgi:AcrR family transcriptional regulator|nr:TetR/AcrR family transcriptional regulator [Rhodospirillales bacterium]|tara:strand:+ start:258 stop:893 length:636 start_codon:yes stop_codon:yes gene_type:complete
MGRRSDHSRDELFEMALSAAREIAEEDGLKGLTIRRIAGKIGYSHGTLYNLFDDQDELILHLNGRTLDALYDTLSAIPMTGDPDDDLLALARGYFAFTRDSAKLWNLLFEHHLSDHQPLPDWHHQKIARLLGLMDRCLDPLFGPERDAEKLHTARVIWSSLHGMCSLETQRKLIPADSIEAMATSLVKNYLGGLRASTAEGADGVPPGSGP